MERNRQAAAVALISIVLVFGIALILWSISVFLLAFSAILFALFLNMLSRWIQRGIRLPYRLSLLLLLVILAVLVGALGCISTPLISHQLRQLSHLLPQAFEQVDTLVHSVIQWGSEAKIDIGKQLALIGGGMIGKVQEIFSLTMGTLIGFIIFVIVGVYIAFQPTLYYTGLKSLFPPRIRGEAERVLDVMGHTLKRWILAKCISIVIIGILTGLGLWALRVPLALILGILSGILAFIPYIGSIIAFIPAVLIALTVDPVKVIWVTILYAVVHALEGYLITPFVEQRTVSLPPALTIMTQVLFSFLLGFMGLALAGPLLVVGMVLAQQVWIYTFRKEVA